MTLKGCLLCLPSLKELAKAKTAIKREKILKHASPKIYSVISEIIRQVLKGTIKIPGKAIKKLNPYKKTLRKIASTKLHNLKRNLINQRGGGFLSSLLIPVITILGRIAADRILE